MGDMWSPWLIPLYVMGVVLVLLLVLVVLGRIKGGKYLRPIMQLLLKVPWLGGALQRMSRAAMERQNPELASAVRKLERVNAARDPQRAQQVLSQLSAAERQAYLDAVADQGGEGPMPANRQQRRQLEKQRKQRR
jgi:biopolymer transport protein ExbB/TolQ